MKNSNTVNYFDANNSIPIASVYAANASNGNGGNRNVLYLTGNTQVIEYNHIVLNTRKNYVCTMTDIIVFMMDNMPENLLIVKTLRVQTQVTWVF